MSKTGYNSNYKKGIRAENQVADMLRQRGFSVYQSPGSRGSADLIASRNDRKDIHVQVKSSSTNNDPYISNAELGRLKSRATRNDAIAAVAKVHNGEADLRYAKNNHKLKL